MLTLWLTLAAVVLLIILSGFFSGSETALTAVSKARMHSLEKNGNRRAGIVAIAEALSNASPLTQGVKKNK